MCENLKFGYLREDDDGHNYVIPEELIEEFDDDQARLYALENRMSYKEWNDKWWDYAEGGSVAHYKVVIP